jgi:hypothetical protein
MYLDHPLKINQILLLSFLSNYRGTIFALGNNDIGVTGILSNPRTALLFTLQRDSTIMAREQFRELFKRLRVALMQVPTLST